jgi:uncharacterized membrane protein YccC
MPSSSFPDPASSATPAAWRQFGHNLLRLGPLPPGRWLFSLRAGFCVAAPVVVGLAAGDLHAGMMAAIGGLTGLYGSGRPYASRALELALVALAFGLAVALGDWVGQAWPLAVVPVVAVIAMLATWLCNALRVGPPGAYLFMLACAAGSAMPVADFSPLQVGLLVTGGGALAWLAHMLGALWAFRGPERAAVQAAGAAVQAWLEQHDTAAGHAARQRAALALHEAWQALVNFQPRRTSPGGPLAQLRGLNRQWHQLFADVLAGRLEVAQARQQAQHLQANLVAPEPLVPAWPAESLPLGRPGTLATLVEALRPGSQSRLVIARVGVAAVLAGAIAAFFGLERAYWAVAAAVLMLHTGMDWARTVQRSVERLLGTWGGLLLTGVLLWWQPKGLWLAAVIFVLQFSVEMLVLRNYLLAALLITATGMLLAAGGHVPADPAGYLLARGVDTLLGCVVALVVFRLMPARQAARQIDHELAQMLQALIGLNSHLAWAELTSTRARQLRAQVSHRRFALAQAWEQAQAGDAAARAHADLRWATVAAVQELTYRMLAMGWVLEQQAPDAARAMAGTLYGNRGVTRVQAALRQLQAGLEHPTGQHLPEGLPAFIAPALQRVWHSLPAPAARSPAATRSG